MVTTEACGVLPNPEFAQPSRGVIGEIESKRRLTGRLNCTESQGNCRCPQTD